MKLQAIVSSIALAAALTFSGTAVAQNMFYGTEIPADQLELFQDRCEALRAASTASLTTGGSDEDVDPITTASIGGQVESDNGDPASQNNWDDALASMTVEQCNQAGFSATM